MPNWCNNLIRISGPRADVQRLANLLNGTEEPFSVIFPRPASEDENWYDWNIANWGTKWDANDFNMSVSDSDIHMHFSTAWSPSEGVTRRMSQRFPTLHIEHLYEEPGMAFEGKLVFENGECTMDEQQDMTGSSCFFTDEGEENPDYVELCDRF